MLGPPNHYWNQFPKGLNGAGAPRRGLRPGSGAPWLGDRLVGGVEEEQQLTVLSLGKGNPEGRRPTEEMQREWLPFLLPALGPHNSLWQTHLRRWWRGVLGGPGFQSRLALIMGTVMNRLSPSSSIKWLLGSFSPRKPIYPGGGHRRVWVSGAQGLLTGPLVQGQEYAEPPCPRAPPSCSSALGIFTHQGPCSLK